MNQQEREELLTMLDSICADEEKYRQLIDCLASLHKWHESHSALSVAPQETEYQ